MQLCVVLSEFCTIGRRSPMSFFCVEVELWLANTVQY